VKAYIVILENPDEIELHVRVEGEDGLVGDHLRVLHPGDHAFGWTYEALRRHGEGMVEVK
jgi:hypothetical protein